MTRQLYTIKLKPWWKLLFEVSEDDFKQSFKTAWKESNMVITDCQLQTESEFASGYYRHPIRSRFYHSSELQDVKNQ